MSTVFMAHTLELCNPNGYMAMINIPVWMFLSSYEKLREELLHDNTLINMVHPGRGIFGSDFGSTVFTFRKTKSTHYKGSYRRLFDTQVEVKTPEIRERQFLNGKGHFIAKQDNFKKIPGSPIAYWVSENFISMFAQKKVDDYALKICKGGYTGENEKLSYDTSFLPSGKS